MSIEEEKERTNLMHLWSYK